MITAKNFFSNIDNSMLNTVTNGNLLMSIFERSYSENEVFTMLLPIFRPLILRYLRIFFAKGEEKDDLYQQGMIGLYNAIRSFRPHISNNFYLHAKKCIRLSILNLVRENNSKKRLFYQKAISLDAKQTDELNFECRSCLYDTTTALNATNPEKIAILTENYQELSMFINKHLTYMELNVLDLYIKGYNYKEIANLLYLPVKSVDNALFRIKKKIRQNISDQHIKLEQLFTN